MKTSGGKLRRRVETLLRENEVVERRANERSLHGAVHRDSAFDARDRHLVQPFCFARIRARWNGSLSVTVFSEGRNRGCRA